MTKIFKTNKILSSDNLILIGNKKSDFSEYIKTKEQNDFIKERITAEKTQIIVNQYERHVFIQLTEEKEDYTIHRKHEELRKASVKLSQSINSLGIASISLINCGAETADVIALTEGLVLSNYQFLKYFDRRTCTFQLPVFKVLH